MGVLPAGAQRSLAAILNQLPYRRRRDELKHVVRDAHYFGVYNLGEVLDQADVNRIIDGFGGAVPSASEIIAGIDDRRGVAGVLDSLVRHLPALRGLPETAWLGQRLDELHRMLPEVVVRGGGMGKAIRATAGVLAIGAYDTLDADPTVRRAHLARILPGAYALGAAYVIVDDTLHDLPGDYISRADRERCHELVVRCLSTGEPIGEAEVPDHPLAEELHRLYRMLLASHPFEEYPHLYQAAEAMYLAQHRDACRSRAEALSLGLDGMYHDIFIKAGMSRVVANIIARRQPPDDCYARCLNTVFLGQFKDDLRDRQEDSLAGRLTPFTFPYQGTGANPLYDLFAYDAYAASEVFHGDPAAVDALTYFGAVKLATHLSGHPDRVDELVRRYDATGAIARCLHEAAGLPARVADRLETTETRIKNHCASILRDRVQTSVEARTFVADRLSYINAVTKRYYPRPQDAPGAPEPHGTEISQPSDADTARPRDAATARSAPVAGLDEIVAYAMSAPGKRLRPALGLMLAEALGIEPSTIEPFIGASELFHTASLVFDDLPAQDNALVRRGRPTAHTVFPEGSVQLAAVSMISSGFGLLARLEGPYPARKVTEVIAYVGSVLGPDRLCRGQHLDLHMASSGTSVTGDEIIEMYILKTSTTIEAALVPLMMLVDRPAEEVEMVRGYAHHAGIVFQIRDDILDVTSSIESLGKDTGNDVGKVNVVRAYGLAEAERLMGEHLRAAIDCCGRLPFDTRPLVGMVHHFANRRK